MVFGNMDEMVAVGTKEFPEELPEELPEENSEQLRRIVTS